MAGCATRLVYALMTPMIRVTHRLGTPLPPQMPDGRLLLLVTYGTVRPMNNCSRPFSAPSDESVPVNFTVVGTSRSSIFTAPETVSSAKLPSHVTSCNVFVTLAPFFQVTEMV